MLSLLLWAAFVAALAGGLWALYRRPPAFTLDQQVPGVGFQGTRQPLSVRATLRTRRPMRCVIELPTPRSVVPDRAPLLVAEVLGAWSGEAQATLTLNRRGTFAWPDATLRWADPLGLFWRSLKVAVPAAIDVLPTTHPLLLPELLRPLLSEGGLTRRLGLDDPISLRGVREYVPGDPPGRVLWKPTARTGTLTVREPERSAASSVMVYVDRAGAVGAGGDVYLESAVRLAASLLREAEALGLPVSAATSAGASPPGTQGGALNAALRLLAQVQPEASAPDSAQNSSAQNSAQIPSVPPGANLFLLTANPGPALIAQAMRARATASRVVIIAMPEGFYLEPGEKARKQWVAAPDTVKRLEAQAGVLAESGIVAFVLRGNQSVLRLGA